MAEQKGYGFLTEVLVVRAMDRGMFAVRFLEFCAFPVHQIEGTLGERTI